MTSPADHRDPLEAERARDRLTAAALEARAEAAAARQRLSELEEGRSGGPGGSPSRPRPGSDAAVIAELRRELNRAIRDKETYRARLQAQHDSTWNQIGVIVRRSIGRPRSLPLLPLRIAKLLLTRRSGGRERIHHHRRGHRPPHDPRFDDVTGRDRRPVLSILDEFTQACLAPELSLVPAEREAFDEQIGGSSLILTETAWRGNDATWSYQFNKYSAGNDLDRFLDLARRSGVPTVIWNKEDPVNYDVFLEVARRFDHVLTTDADIIDRYRRDLGHDRVSAMMFAAQPLLHNPIGRPRTPLTSVCFAGAWRGDKYPGRAERLSTLLDAAVDAGELVIFDREPTSDDGVGGFPTRFHPFIAGSIPYRSMVDEYRRHAAFLNVNTVEESSTMMSRRVFEILACRTPVVSTPSAAIDAQLADVVLTPTGRAETNEVVARLVHDADHRDRLGQRGFRTVMSAHTYQHRIAEVFNTLGLDGFPSPHEPAIDVICVTSRPQYLRRALDNFRRQSYLNRRLIFVTNSDDFDTGEVEALVGEFDDARIMHLPPTLTLGECLNAALDVSDAEFFAKFDDDDHYGAHYLSDMVLATRFADATVYGKRTFHAHVEALDCTVVRHEGHEFEHTNLVMGGTLLVKRADIGDLRFEAVPSGTDTRFLKACSARGLDIFSTDRFNYLMVRRADIGHHTWQISDTDFMSTSRRLGDGLMLDEVLI